MKKITKYVIVDPKNHSMGGYDTEAEAIAAVERAARRGWSRSIVKVEWEIKDNPETWELDGAMVNPEFTKWELGEW